MVPSANITILESAYRVVLIGTLIFLSLMLLLCLIRAIKGPQIADRILAVNMMSTMVLVMIAVLALLLEEAYLVDICIIYAMINFLAVVVLTKVFMGIHKERQLKELEGDGDNGNS